MRQRIKVTYATLRNDSPDLHDTYVTMRGREWGRAWASITRISSPGANATRPGPSKEVAHRWDAGGDTRSGIH
jgi:hypothetical protein